LIANGEALAGPVAPGAFNWIGGNVTPMFASEDYSKFAIVLLIPIVVGVPSVLVGGIMTLSAIYERRQTPRQEYQHASRRLEIGVTLLVMGIVSLAVLAGIVISAT
jgi:heme/copper-type cytochrome/quinol oxidase subunit 2